MKPIPLSEIQKVFLGHLSREDSLKAIATKMGKSDKTAQYHCAQLKKKLGVSFYELIRIAARRSIMKRLCLLPFLLLALNCQGQLRTNITLVWDYPFPDVTNTAFRVYQTTNLSDPIPWRLAAQAGYGVTNISMPVVPSMQWFYVTATNLIGESNPSNIALCPAPPRSDVLLRVR